MMESKQRFFVRGVQIGIVDQIESHPGLKRGNLALYDCPERTKFEAVVSLAHNVDIATSDEFQARWEIWRRACGELQDSILWIGDGKAPIEQFSIESDWSIEWQDADDVELAYPI